MAWTKLRQLLLLTISLTAFFSVITVYSGYGGDIIYGWRNAKVARNSTVVGGDSWLGKKADEYPGRLAVIDTLEGGGNTGEMSLADQLYKSVRVVCWILTTSTNLATKATAVKNTWAKHFNEYLFMSSKAHPKFPTVGLNVSEGRKHLTAKTMQAFRYLHKHYHDKADWFMKADDDTFVIAENLRFFLSHFSPDDPLYFGFHFKPFVPTGFMSGGAGYVLSRAALKLLAEKGGDPQMCAQDGEEEDIAMGRCVAKLGIKSGKSLDAEGRETFHPFKPSIHFAGRHARWFYQYAINTVKKGYGCCSDYSISFHYMSPEDMYFTDFMLYHLRPIGVNSVLPSKRMFNSGSSLPYRR